LAAVGVNTFAAPPALVALYVVATLAQYTTALKARLAWGGLCTAVAAVAI